ERPLEADLVALLVQDALLGHELVELDAHRLRHVDGLTALHLGPAEGPAPDDVEAARLVDVTRSLAVDDALEGIIGDDAAHLVEQLGNRDFFAAELEDALVPTEDLDRRADGRHEEVGPADALGPEVVEA